MTLLVLFFLKKQLLKVFELYSLLINQFRRHVSQCTASVSYSAQEEIHDNSQENNENLLFSSEDEAINYERYISKQKYRPGKTFPNISEEDVEAFFDADRFMVDESSESSDYDSDLSDYCMQSDEEKDTRINLSDEKSMDLLTRFICIILMLWQTVYYISDSAVETMLKLLSIIFQFLSRYSSALRTLASVFHKTCTG